MNDYFTDAEKQGFYKGFYKGIIKDLCMDSIKELRNKFKKKMCVNGL